MAENIQGEKRTFGLSTFAVDNRTSIFILAIMIMIFGFQAYKTMPKEQYPEVKFPKVFVNTVYFGNAPKDIENLVSRPIEKEVASISGLKKVTSSSLQDYSLIIAEFNDDVDIDKATQLIKDAVDRAKPELPTDLTKEPEVLDVDVSKFPIMVVNVAGDYSVDRLKAYAEDLQDALENDIREVSEAQLKGDLDREVQVNMDFRTMQAYGITFSDVERAIQSENITMSGGELINNDFRRNVRIVGEFKTVEDIRNLIIKSERQRPIYLRDIASVNFTYAEATSVARSDGKPVVSLDIIKRDGANLLSASDQVKEVIKHFEENVFPENLEISVFNDASVMTRDSVSTLENSIISGVILVIVVLLFFLGIRNATFVGMAIPLSMLMGIMVLSFMGYTLNMMILFGLILSLGLLVDNGIVVVENIYRYISEGNSNVESAKYGAGEVAMPIIASTATTLAAFIPLMFWPGLMGSFMKYLPITVVIILLSSLVVALVINPVFAARFMKIDEREDDATVKKRKTRNTLIGAVLMGLFAVAAYFIGKKVIGNVLVIALVVSLLHYFLLRPASFFFQERIMPAMERGYHKVVNFFLSGFNPGITFLGTIGLLVLSFVLIGSNPPKVKYTPDTDPAYVNVFVEMPIGKDIDATNALVKEIEIKVNETLEPYEDAVSAVLTQIGENTSDPNSEPEFGASPHKSRITISFVPFLERNGVNTADAFAAVRSAMTGVPGAEVTVDKDNSGPPVGKPISIELSGDDIDQLAQLSDDIKRYLKSENIPGVEELKSDVLTNKPELLIDIDREVARKYELSTFAISDAIRTSLFGKEISKFKVGEDEYPIQLRMDERYRNNIEYLLSQKITFRSPATGKVNSVPIATAASFDYSSTFSSIKRKDQKRNITISSNVLAQYNANEVVADVQEALEAYPMPAGFSYTFGGEQVEQAESMAYLSSAFVVAIFVIFIILVAQFNSVISPFIIILSIVFSTIGVMLGYYITGMDFIIIMSGIGIISLAGIVVNNAIVMVDYINLRVQKKRESLGIEDMMSLPKQYVKEAIIAGGSTRLRPVLLTAITTILGLLPLATAFNFNFGAFISDFSAFASNVGMYAYFGGDVAQFWQAMAWTVIYGLVFATVLTLIVVPVMYWLAYRLKAKFVKA